MSPPPENESLEMGHPDKGGEALLLEVPPVAAYVGTARLFAGAVARHFNVEEGLVEDLKVAVSEACNGAIRVRSLEVGDRSIRIACSRQRESLVFQVEDAFEPEASSVASTTEDIVRGLGLELIQALFPHARMIPSSGGNTTMQLSVALGGAPRESDASEP